ncbi:MAG: T9SS type A sorting domain-containing protein [Sphingobacteriaceae bacterium]|jgi:hypothetical protein
MKSNIYSKLVACLAICLSTVSVAQNCYSPGNGSNGAYSATSNTTIAGGEYNFTSFNINPGVIVTVTGNNPLVIKCNGIATINGTISANGGNGTNGITSSTSGIGGVGVAGGANGGNGVYSSSAGPLNGTSGFGLGGVNTNGIGWSGGGGAGYANTGSSSGSSSGGFGGPTYGNAPISPTVGGSGGGGGSGGFSCGSGGGGAGGGVIIIQTASLTIGASGMVSSNGGNGGSDGTGNCGGGGGGSGGSLLLASPGMTINGQLSAKGGIGGASAVPGSPYFGTGANGSVGRIRLDYNNTLTGTGTYTPAVGYTTTISTPITASITSSNALCFNACNGSATISASGPPSLTYSWVPGNYTTSAVSSLCAGNYTAIVYDASLCSASFTMAITQPSLLTVNANTSNTVICSGNQVTLTASSSGGTGATTYSWSNTSTGSLTTASPSANTVYTVTATDDNSCTATKTIQVNINPLPTLSVSANPTIVCSGQSSTLNVSGANTYTWNTASNATSIAVSPTVSSTYTVSGTNNNGCTAQSVTSVSVSIPVINVSSPASVMCLGSAVVISASGVNTYTWNTSSNSSSITVSPTVNTNYTVTGTSALGCTVSSVFTQSVANCAGLVDHAANINATVKPNPTNGKIVVNGLVENVEFNFNLTNQLGMVVISNRPIKNNTEIDLTLLPNGIYFLTIQTESTKKTIKVIKD